MPNIRIDTASNKRLNWGAKGTERIVQNVSNIINTYRFEVAYMRGLGISPDIIDKGANEVRAIIADDLSRQIKFAEPRAVLKSIDIVSINEDGSIGVIVDISV